ncbi:hypothetical protein MRB53_003712 [Persea americana]|uniref:Uncharacterized protein n=1 Tax=Persea americana TaxID=3435 RepID=A0ACC2MY98_PERAE|nr:hypothetical protein MRB53_003712 [Persea americana]
MGRGSGMMPVSRLLAAGDTLVFKYPPGQHNVVPVNGAGYSSCKASAISASKAVSTGNDKFKLKMGANYFICSLPGHCHAGMKLQVNANWSKYVSIWNEK